MSAPASVLGQRGSFLLEALIAILIVALGVLGSVGLLARSMQDVDDAKFRGEAAYLANAYIGQMWVADRTTTALNANFASSTGANYIEFKSMVESRLPNAASCPADVTVTAGPIGAPNPLTNSIVTVQVYWLSPKEKTASSVCPTDYHQHSASGTIGANR